MKSYSGGRVHVMSGECSTCVFRPGNLMKLPVGRLAGMVESALADESAIICHSTLIVPGAQEGVCRGFFDRYGGDSLALRLAQMLDVVTFVDPPKEWQ